MEVIKRDGTRQRVMYDKITARIEALCGGLDSRVDPAVIAQEVIKGMRGGMHTHELDTLAAQTAAYYATHHPDFSILAARISVSDLHKRTNPSFSETIAALHAYVHPKTGEPAPLISDEVHSIVMANSEVLDAAVDHSRDFDFDFFGFKTLERSYLLRTNGEITERPQHMYMRVAVGIHMDDTERVIETYNLMSQKYFTHATPTLFNAGTPQAQMSSCFLLQMKEDSIDGIYDTLKTCAQISKYAGGIGLAIHKIRATDSYIRGTNGESNGLVPMLRVFSDTARYVDQCFDPRTVIYTDEGPAAIGDLEVGNCVLTHEGRFQEVTRVLKHKYKGRVLRFASKHDLEPVTVTGQHPFYTLRGQQKGVSYSVIRNRLEKGFVVPEWTEASDLCDNDMIGYPVPQVSAYTGEDVSLDDAYFLGIMVGDGHIPGDGQRLSHVTLNCTMKADMYKWVCEYLAERGQHYTESKSTDSKARRISWTPNAAMSWITRDMLYDEEGEKKLPQWALHMHMDKTRALLRGILQTDGHVTEAKSRDISLEMTSMNVIQGVRYMLMRGGTLTSGYLRDHVGESHAVRDGEVITVHKPTAVLRIPKTEFVAETLGIRPGKFVSMLLHEGVMWTRVKSMEWEEFDGEFLVDLEVEGDHSYVVSAGAVHNGGGKRKGSFAIYLEPWHADIFAFLDLKKNHGKEELRARDLFYALWTPDLFMKRAMENGKWSLFCPNEAPGLADVWGDEFEELYTRYEREGRAREVVSAQKLFMTIVNSQIETGVPYMLYKDACNGKSNQQNLGTIRSSNLCTEIVEYTAPDEVAVCNLASIALNMFVTEREGGGMTFNHEHLHATTKIVTRNLDKVIDLNYYPVPEARNSNMRHRPVGIGVQGLADAFAIMRLPFDSLEARKLNVAIFETLYHAAVEASCELAQEKGAYPTFEGSPASQGKLQPDLWGVTPSDRYDWDALRAAVKTHGMRNSLLIAPMPTASTAQIMGNNESTEPFTANLYNRRVLSGEFVVVNKHMLRDLTARGLWTEEVRNQLMHDNGSIQNIASIPDDLKLLYRTVWEISQKTIIEMAAERAPFICQSQSLNIHMADPTPSKISSMHFFAWKCGLKTGMYYLRTKPRAQTIKFTVNPALLTNGGGGGEDAGRKPEPEPEPEPEVCRRRVGDDGEECIVCGS